MSTCIAVVQKRQDTYHIGRAAAAFTLERAATRPATEDLSIAEAIFKKYWVQHASLDLIPAIGLLAFIPRLLIPPLQKLQRSTVCDKI